jgi:hypothetical protein
VLMYQTTVLIRRPRRNAINHGGGEIDIAVNPPQQLIIDQRRKIADHRLGDRAILGKIVTRKNRDRTRAGIPPGHQTGDKSCRQRAHGATRVAAQHFKIGNDHVPIGVEAAVGVADIASLGDGDGHQRGLLIAEVSQVRVVVGGRVDSGEGAN